MALTGVSSRPVRIAVAGCALWLLAGGLAHAQEEDADVRDAAARGMFEQALEAFDAGDPVRAEALFRRSLELRWSAPAALNLAEILIERGAFAETRALLSRIASDHAVPEEVRARVRERHAALAGRVARLRLVVPAGAEVVLDDEPLAPTRLALPIEVDPGRHVIVVGTETTRVALAAGEEQTLRLPTAPGAILSAGAGAANTTTPSDEAASPGDSSDETASEDGDDSGLVIGLSVGLGVAAAIAVGVLIGVLAAPSGTGQLGPPTIERR